MTSLSQIFSTVRRIATTATLVATLALPATSQAFQQGYPTIQSTGTIYRVIDADTFVINIDDPQAYAQLVRHAQGDPDRLRYLNDRFQSTRVRLANVDTPESVHRDESRNTPEGRRLSAKAKQMLEGQRTTVSCFDWGHWGRSICSITKPNGKDFAEWLIQEGHSPYVTSWGRNPLHHQRYVQAAQ